ncbi:SLAP domain-containing protein [Lactobacillus terrae]|uniref:SLAP domain-containing protein n=1 Tax=Lactobacillus terrae TaxID=2269374 RepID=UPI000C1B6B61|nr:SLAP domain-containing protein [Lactobacillus terrae]
MKKSIKYAGIAAAALLTVAPIATPIASNVTTTVKAADNDSQGTIMAATTRYITSLSDNSSLAAANLPEVSDLPIATSGSVLDTKNTISMSYSNFSSHFGQVANPNYAGDTDVLTKPANDVKIVFTITNSKGTVVKNSTQLEAVDSLGKGYTINVLGYTYNNGTSTEAAYQAKDVVFTPTESAKAIKKANVTYSDSIRVDPSSATSAVKTSASSDLKVTNNNGGATVTGLNLNPGVLYTTENGAIKGSGTTYTKANFGADDATYYQRIVVTSVNNAQMTEFLTELGDVTTGYSITINGSTVKAADMIALSDNSFAVIRKVNVADAPVSDGWTYSDLNGVVTTGSKDVYTLKNDDNKDVANRALAGGTDWKTNSVRTNAAGEKQYRVATNEWINASDVTYKDSTNPGTGISNIQTLTGSHVVVLDTPGFVYPLYQQDGKTSSRYVAGGTSWVTDQTGTDANGVVYYRVSTTEWVMAGQGVNFK